MRKKLLYFLLEKICNFFYLPFIFKSNLYFLLSIFYVSDEYVLSFIYLLYFCLVFIFFYLPFILESIAPIVELLNYCVTVNLVPSIIYLMQVLALMNAANNSCSPTIIDYTEFYNMALDHMDLMKVRCNAMLIVLYIQ